MVQSHQAQNTRNIGMRLWRQMNFYILPKKEKNSNVRDFKVNALTNFIHVLTQCQNSVIVIMLTTCQNILVSREVTKLSKIPENKEDKNAKRIAGADKSPQRRNY